MNAVAAKIEVGRRVIHHGAYGARQQGVIVAVRGMEDIYEYNDSAWCDVFGDAKYIDVNREWRPAGGCCMKPMWESDVIEFGSARFTVQAVGGMVVLTRRCGDLVEHDRLTPQQALLEAGHVDYYGPAIAEALINAANRVQQAIDAAKLSREGADA